MHVYVHMNAYLYVLFARHSFTLNIKQIVLIEVLDMTISDICTITKGIWEETREEVSVQVFKTSALTSHSNYKRPLSISAHITWMEMVMET